MKRTGKLIVGATFAASMLFTKGIAPAFKLDEYNGTCGSQKYCVSAEKYNAENLNAEEEQALNFSYLNGEIATANESELAKSSKAAYLIESKSKTPIYNKNESNRMPIASMCKIMTLLLAFDCVRSGELLMEENITISQRAAGMGGSQVFLEYGAEYKTRDLLRSIAVCSANDSCVAIAERIAGTEEAFVDKMNEKAKELGMHNTLFANCTGLPRDPQYSCAKDVATMLSKLLENQEYFDFCKVWTEKFKHPKDRITEITNTNKLVRFYQGCDGGKTGFTAEAGFCLAATATRGGMRIVSVVIGADTSKHRFDDVRCMFDYAFANYTLKTVIDNNNLLTRKISVTGGKKEEISVKAEKNSYVFGKRGEQESVTIAENYSESLKAPIRAGDHVGELVIFKNNVEIDRVKIVAAESVEKAGFFDRFKAILRGWKIGKLE